MVLALEPESAALLCKQLALTKTAGDINIQMFESGSKFMVVDCGDALLFDSDVIFYMYANFILLNLDIFMSCLTGGTVDVTAYVVEDKQV